MSSSSGLLNSDAAQLQECGDVLRVREARPGGHRTDGETLQSKVSQKRKGSREVQVSVCRLLCKVSGDCQVVLRRLPDREVRGRLITILRGKGEVLYSALCGTRSWVSSTGQRGRRFAG